MLSPTYEITTALSHTDELISPPYDIAIVTISYGRVIMSSVWDSMMSKKNVGWPFYAAVVMTISMMGRGIASYVKYTKLLGTPPCPAYDAPEWYAKNWNYFALSLSETMAHISKNILYFIVGDTYSSMPKY